MLWTGGINSLLDEAKLEMVPVRFFPDIFNKSSTDSVVTGAIHNQKEQDKGSAGHEGFAELIRAGCISAGCAAHALRVMDSVSSSESGCFSPRGGV